MITRATVSTRSGRSTTRSSTSRSPRSGSSPRARCPKPARCPYGLRVPTLSARRNFAFLMVADAREARAGFRRAAALRRRSRTTTAEDAINAARGTRGKGFADAFPGEYSRASWTPCAISSGARRWSRASPRKCEAPAGRTAPAVDVGGGAAGGRPPRRTRTASAASSSARCWAFSAEEDAAGVRVARRRADHGGLRCAAGCARPLCARAWRRTGASAAPLLSGMA